MPKFDPASLNDWKNRGITNVTVELFSSGCAGTKVRVLEGMPSEVTGWIAIQSASITMHMRESEYPKFENARLTRVNGKWILASEQVKSRCGCGSSFSFETTEVPKSQHATNDATLIGNRILTAKLRLKESLGKEGSKSDLTAR